MRWPDEIAPGTRVTMDVSHVDITPTLLAAAGLEQVADMAMDGENLLPHVTGQRPQPAVRDLFSGFVVPPAARAHHGIEDWYAIYRRPWNYAWHANGETELYNLDKDPWETTNLAGNPAHRRTRTALHATLACWLRGTGGARFERFASP